MRLSFRFFFAFLLLGIDSAALAAAPLSAALVQVDPNLVSLIAANQLAVFHPARAAFRLDVPKSVEAGQNITVNVVRVSGDGAGYTFGIRFTPPELVASPIIEIGVAAGAVPGPGRLGR